MGPAGSPDASTARGAVYFGGLDGLRFVAAYAVLVHHVEQTLEMHGYASAFGHPVIERIGIEAVHFFFVLSGYLITYLLLTERARTGTVAIGRFYVRRILRIWPLYYAIVFVGLWLGPRLPGLAWPGAYLAIDTGSPIVVLLYLVILPNAVWRFFGVLPHAAQLWSIGIEEQFYLIWPALMRWARRPVVAVLAVFLFFPGLRLALAVLRRASTLDMTSTGWQVVAFIGEQPFHCMAIGALAACAHHDGALAPGQPWAQRLFRAPVRVALYTLLALSLLAPVELPRPVHWLMPLLYAWLCLDVAVHRAGARGLDTPWLRKLGQISYGIYMVHSFVIALALRFVVDVLGWGPARFGWRPLLYGCSTAATLVVAWASYRWLESPLLALKRRFEVVRSGG